jgi:succinate dehydrogenase (ubiquinone) membrane anchor subunit
MKGSYHWVYERIVATATLPLIVGAFVTTSPIIDMGLGLLLPVHAHMGIDTCITDYVPARKFPVLNRICKGALYIGTGLTVYGFYKYNTESVGITEGVKQIWQGTKSQ